MLKFNHILQIAHNLFVEAILDIHFAINKKGVDIIWRLIYVSTLMFKFGAHHKLHLSLTANERINLTLINSTVAIKIIAYLEINFLLSCKLEEVKSSAVGRTNWHSLFCN